MRCYKNWYKTLGKDDKMAAYLLKETIVVEPLFMFLIWRVLNFQIP